MEASGVVNEPAKGGESARDPDAVNKDAQSMPETFEGPTCTTGQSTKLFVVAALYKFALLENYTELRAPLREHCESNGILGTLLLAREGINGTVSGTREGIDALLQYLRSDPRLSELDHKESFHEEAPFARLKVRLKNEIVTLGVPGVDPTSTVGQYVNPKEWNSLISDPDVLLIDTRNKYEVALGTFRNAVDPKTDSFREFPAFCEKALADAGKDKKIAMFCTGGIRCEKSTSYLKMKGYENVYHLKGGILKYLEEVDQKQSLWDGQCYVFDQRVAVKHDLKKGDFDSCGSCRAPLSAEDRVSKQYREGLSCPYCHDVMTEKHRLRVEARARQLQIAEERGVDHNVFFSRVKKKTKKQNEKSTVASQGVAA